MEFIRHKKILGSIGLVGLFIGIFFPYFTFSSLGYGKAIVLWDYWQGKVIFLLTLITMFVIFYDSLGKYLGKFGKKLAKISSPKVVFLPTILILGLFLLFFLSLDIDRQYFDYGIGCYAIWIGIFGCFFHALFYKEAIPINQRFVQEKAKEIDASSFQQVALDPNSKKYCPNCKTQVNASADVCFLCGYHFNK